MGREQDRATGRERRRYYRLRYPVQCRPSITVDGACAELTEISECGLRYLRPDEAPEIGAKTRAEIRFPDDGVVVIVDARLIRHEESESVLQFDHGVTLSRMLKEQRRVIRHNILSGQTEEREGFWAQIKESYWE